MCLHNLSGIVLHNRNYLTAGLFREFKASLLERCHFPGPASGSLRENGYRYTVLDIFDTLKHGLKSLLDILSVKEKTVQKLHPVVKKRYLLHLLLSNEARKSWKH